MPLDLVVRDGTVIDGTGAPARVADVGIADGRVVALGDVDDHGTREIDAEGRLVTPGFVDLHTHLDAQIHWDRLATSSCWHGVTSIVLGNCGVTFAPVRAADRSFLAEMMESVEDIPAGSIREGLPWDWETYGEYLASLASRPLGVNVGGMVGHCPLRWWAMGERSVEPGAHPTDDELAEMCRLVGEAVDAGALGFSTSRTLRHRVPDGRYVPGTWAEPPELVAIAQVLARRGRGIVECAPRFDGEGDPIEKVESELAWMELLSRETGRPVTFNLSQTREQGDHWIRAIELAEAANARGASIRPQSTTRGIGVLLGLWNLTPFDAHPAWRALGPTLEERLAALRDPVARARLVEEAERGPDAEACERFFVVTPERGVRYEPDPSWSLTAVARRRGVSCAQAFVDLCLETDGRVILNWPILNHDYEAIARMITSPTVVMGLADSGAHVGQILDASQPTYYLTYWVRERGLVGIEEAIRRITSDTAAFAGLEGRGVLREGAHADLNVIDFEGLTLEMPEYVRDFPGGAGRFVQRASGYEHTIVNGEVFLDDGEPTGALAGTVLRG
jgi:N-acyl-D-aspartate/D-glutamate deacylase